VSARTTLRFRDTRLGQWAELLALWTMILTISAPFFIGIYTVWTWIT